MQTTHKRPEFSDPNFVPSHEEIHRVYQTTAQSMAAQTRTVLLIILIAMPVLIAIMSVPASYAIGMFPVFCAGQIIPYRKALSRLKLEYENDVRSMMNSEVRIPLRTTLLGGKPFFTNPLAKIHG